MQSLLAFYAISGSDCTSKFAGISKKTAWKVFLEHFQLLTSLGKTCLALVDFHDAETFVGRLYNIENDLINAVWASMFRKYNTNIYKLPQGKDLNTTCKVS